MGTYDIARAALLCPTREGRGIPVKIEGPVGVGKTSKIQQLARRLRMHDEVLTLSLMESVEAHGHPFLNERTEPGPGGKLVKRKEMAYAPPAWALRATQARRAIIYLDEINMAMPSTFAAFMRVVNERHCGAFPLGEGVRFIAACNPTDVAASAGGVDLPMALNNRFCHLKVDLPDFEEWVGWIGMGEFSDDEVVEDIDALEARIDAEWPAAYGRASAEVAGYLAARPNARLRLPKGVESAFPTPRTWEMLIRARAISGILDLSAEDRAAFEAGCIGAANAAEFRVWVTEQDLPSAAAWLAGSVDFEPDHRRLDRTQAFLLSIALEWANMPSGDVKTASFNRVVSFFGHFLSRRDILMHATAILGSKGGADAKKAALALAPANRAILADIGMFRTSV